MELHGRAAPSDLLPLWPGAPAFAAVSPGTRDGAYLLRNHLLGHAVRSPSESSRLPDAPVRHSHAVRDAAVHCAHAGMGRHVCEGASARERRVRRGNEPRRRAARRSRPPQKAPLSAEDRAALRAHELELQESLTQARRFGFIAQRAVPVIALIAVVAMGLLIVVSSRVAGHLSRQLSRPIDELVGWTDRLGRGEELPEGVPRKGAPEFAVLRSRMRSVARELRDARAREIEAERLRAFRESARQVAHELKNPLTPIRFAVARLRRDAPASLSDAVDVLDAESRRLEEMARSFSQFGRLPEGPPADVDVGGAGSLHDARLRSARCGSGRARRGRRTDGARPSRRARAGAVQRAAQRGRRVPVGEYRRSRTARLASA